MSRRGFTAATKILVREIARAERARQRQIARRTADQARALRKKDADSLTRAVEERERAIENLLLRNPVIKLNKLLQTFEPGSFDDTQWLDLAPPDPNAFAPVAPVAPDNPGLLGWLRPRSSKRQAEKVIELKRQKVIELKRQFELAETAYKERLEEKAAAVATFEANEDARRSKVDRHNASVHESGKALEEREHLVVVSYFKLAIARSLKDDPDAVSAQVGYSADSRHLVVDLELPEISVVPEAMRYRRVDSGRRVKPVIRPVGKLKALYSNLICRCALKCIDTVFRSDPKSIVSCLTLNGMLDTIDPATGQKIRVCLLSVRVTADVFRSLNLRQVQPEHCLRSLKASVSRAPDELLPVKPIVEINMVDPRFVDTLDVMSGLDQRPNLMELSPTEFEGLITNLFEAMGLNTRQTRPSRDGGVDCVAFDPRPIIGGKVVVQAKRYKNTVGVSAVRDLFGTVQNEGASKGILVTTSGYGKAAFEFAQGKPLELLDGRHLLHLLAEYADIEARIVIPEGWVDAPIHGE
jgi:restriction system protein